MNPPVGSLMGLQWDLRIVKVSFLLYRTFRMAMVSEFLGQLSLNIGVNLNSLSLTVHWPRCVQFIPRGREFDLFIPSHPSVLWTHPPHCGACPGLRPWPRCCQTRNCYQNQRQDASTLYSFSQTKNQRSVLKFCQMSRWDMWGSIVALVVMTILGTPPSQRWQECALAADWVLLATVWPTTLVQPFILFQKRVRCVWRDVSLLMGGATCDCH